MYQIMSYYLENGIRVYFHRVPNIKILTAGIIVRHGSSNENEETNGISHFIEHLIMNKNTENEIMLKGFDEALNYGASYNAETTKDSTFFYFTGLSDGLETYLDCLKESLFINREYSEKLFNNEKKVVLQEYHSTVSSFNQIQERTMQALYGNSGLGRMIIGKSSNIASFSKKQIVEKINQVYTPENCSIMIIGDFDEYEVMDKIKEKFNYIKDTPTIKFTEKVSDSPSIYHNPNYNGSKSVLSIGFRHYENERNDLYRLANKIIVHSMSNFILSKRMVYVLREKMGLIYNASGFAQNNGNFHSVGFYTVFDSDNVSEVVKVMLEEIQKLHNNGFEEKEFNYIKNNILTARLQERVNMEDQIYYFAKSIKNDSMYSPENDIRIIKNMTVKDANEVVKTILDMNNAGIACIGNCVLDKVVELM